MGPLQGVKIVELAGIGPGPFAGMVLSDMGADIVRVDRAEQVDPAAFDKPNLEPLYRGRRSIGVDLKNPEGVELVLRLVEQADALFEGFRPGVTERLGSGPTLPRPQPKLVYGRMTGWGQDGPMAQAAGPRHQLHRARRRAGALRSRRRQADAADQPRRRLRRRRHVHGVRHRVRHPRSAALGQGPGGRRRDGRRRRHADVDDLGAEADRRLGRDAGHNMLDTGAPFYDTYETADGKFVSLGSLEPQFYAELISGSASTTKACPRRWIAAVGTRCARASPSCSRRRRATSGTVSSGDRRVLRAGAHDVGSDEQRAHRGPPDDHRARRCAAARARAAFSRTAGRGPAVGAVARSAHRRGAGDGVSTRRRGEAAGDGRDR